MSKKGFGASLEPSEGENSSNFPKESSPVTIFPRQGTPGQVCQPPPSAAGSAPEQWSGRPSAEGRRQFFESVTQISSNRA